MKKVLDQTVEANRMMPYSTASDGLNGAFCFFRLNQKLMVIISDGGGWDHVSVSLKNRCPTWDEMCFIKDLFFEPDETVVQFHPKQSEYVNNHPYCLHMWRKQGQEYELPPSEFVGIKK